MGEGGRVAVVQRHMQRGLGLSTVTMLTFVAVSSASVFQPCAIKTQEFAGFDCVTRTANLLINTNQLIAAAVVVDWNEKLQILVPSWHMLVNHCA